MRNNAEAKSTKTSSLAKIQIVLTIIGVSGIVLIFVPFTSNVVPFTDVLLRWQDWDSLAVMAAPCIILPVPISFGYAVWLVKRRLPSWTVIAGYALSSLFALAILASIIRTSSYDVRDLLLGLLFLIAFSGAAWLSGRGIRNDPSIRGLVAMQCVYSIPMTYYLVFFAGTYQVGGWLGLTALLVYLTQIGLAVSRLIWLLAIIGPIACVNLMMLWFPWL